MRNDFCTGYLMHHGIQGQKWGVRNGPPYPLKRTKRDIRGYDASTSKEDPNNLKQYAKGINPTGSKDNCGSVAGAIISNLNGGDNIALDHTPEHMRIPGKQGYDPEKLIDCYEGASWETIHGNNKKEICDNIQKKVLSYGEGANGIFYPDEMYGRRDTHYFAFAVKNNEMNVIEGQGKRAQEGIVYTSDFDTKVGENIIPGEVHFARLDNHPVKNGREKDLYQERKKGD